jgi:hypothetical protein
MDQDLNGTLERHLADVISPGSSRGPVRTGAFKPDISAPGTNIVAPLRGGGDRGVSQSGTSMSSPMVAGAAAVVVERLRDEGLAPEGRLNEPDRLSARDVGAMLMNYANATVWRTDSRIDDPVPLARQGAGRVDVHASAKGETLLRAGPIASVSFGYRAVSDTHTDSAVVTVRNLSEGAKQYRLTTVANSSEDEDAGVEYSASPSELELGAGESEDISLGVTIDASAMRAYGGYGGQLAMREAELADAEMDAFLVVTEVDGDGDPIPDGDVARVPIYLHARSASEIRIAPDPMRVSPESGEGTYEIANDGGGWGRAELFDLIGEDPVEHDVHPRLNIDYVGARVNGQLLEIAVHTTGTRLLPLDTQLMVILDTDLDGEMDWLVQNYDLGFYSTGGRQVTGQQVLLRQVTQNSPLQTSRQASVLPYFADMNIESRTIVLPLPLQQLGLSTGGPVTFAAVVRHVGLFADTHGGAGYVTHDLVPEDGFVIVGQSLGVGEGRLTFDDAARPFTLSTWSEELTSEGNVSGRLEKTGDGLEESRVLASYITNPPASDIQILSIVESDEPVEPTPTVTPPPGPKGEIFVPIIYRRYALPAAPTATPTATTATEAAPTATEEAATQTPTPDPGN